jgi:hypothetical protein
LKYNDYKASISGHCTTGEKKRRLRNVGNSCLKQHNRVIVSMPILDLSFLDQIPVFGCALLERIWTKGSIKFHKYKKADVSHGISTEGPPRKVGIAFNAMYPSCMFSICFVWVWSGFELYDGIIVQQRQMRVSRKQFNEKGNDEAGNSIFFG